MPSVNNTGQVQYQSGELLPSVGSSAYKAAQSGMIVPQNFSGTIPPKPTGTPVIDGSRLGTVATAAIPAPITLNTASNGLSNALATTFTGSQTQGKDGSVVTTYSDGTNNAQVDTAATKKTTLDTIAEGLKSIFTKQGTKGQRTLEIQNQEGVQQKQNEVRTIENRSLALDKSYADRIEKLRQTFNGSPEGFAKAAGVLERERDSQKADLAIQFHVAQGNYQSAFEIAQAKVNAEFEPLQAEIENYKTQLDLYRNNMTDSEKMDAQAQLQEKQRQLDFARDKELYKYKQQIDQQDPMYKAQIANIYSQIGERGATSAANSDVAAYTMAYQAGQVPLTQVPQKIRGEVLAATQASGTNKMLGLVQQYRDKLNGLNIITAQSPGNKTALANLKGQITAEYKQQKQLGTLDNGVQKLIDSIIPDPSKLNLSSLSNKAQVAAIDNFIANQAGSKPEEKTKDDPLGLGI